VSVLIGAAAFGETVRTGIVPTTVEVVSFVAIVLGIFLLAHTDVVKVAQRHYTLEQEREKAKTDAEVSSDGSPAEVPPEQSPGRLSVQLPPAGYYERR
jgi:hypothetical protein